MENENKAKPQNVKIKTITVNSTGHILGLGDDDVIYYWVASQQSWFLFT